MHLFKGIVGWITQENRHTIWRYRRRTGHRIRTVQDALERVDDAVDARQRIGQTGAGPFARIARTELRMAGAEVDAADGVVVALRNEQRTNRVNLMYSKEFGIFCSGPGNITTTNNIFKKQNGFIFWKSNDAWLLLLLKHSMKFYSCYLKYFFEF